MDMSVRVIRGKGGTQKPLGMCTVPQCPSRGMEFELKEFPGVRLKVNTIINGELLVHASDEDYDERLNAVQGQVAA